MPLQSGLDLFRVDLLTAAVDRHRAPAEHRDATVLLDRRVVAGDRVADAIDGLESLRRLRLVLVVADGNVALLGDEAADSGARLDLVAVVIEDDRPVVDRHTRGAAVWCVFGDEAGAAKTGLRQAN